jgi:hypothetical protein
VAGTVPEQRLDDVEEVPPWHAVAEFLRELEGVESRLGRPAADFGLCLADLRPEFRLVVEAFDRVAEILLVCPLDGPNLGLDELVEVLDGGPDAGRRLEVAGEALDGARTYSAVVPVGRYVLARA